VSGTAIIAITRAGEAGKPALSFLEILLSQARN
jgi:hypothetical protein